MEGPFKVLFVCMGNICRSPAGECIFRHIVESEGHSDTIEIDSAGTIGFHTGNSPDSRMRSAGAKRGYRIEGAARQLAEDDFQKFDLIVTMDDANFENASAIAPQGESRASLRKFCDFCEHHSDQEVPDPYYGGQSGFEHVLDLMEDGCRGILKYTLEKSGM
ncbi:MAG: low molecular weight protein-tyrosine-phosphatase [Opitutales bacterium]